MSSSFSWLDYSEAERRRALDVADAFKNRDTRDELGIGAVRDAFANILFPGTTTIQTRARYFLFVPYIYLSLEKKLRSKPSKNRDELSKAARREELALIDILKKSDPEGTIGITAGDKLKRLPSNIYWYGMGAWGVRRVDLSQEEYHKRLIKFGAPMITSRNDEHDNTGAARTAFNWHPGLYALKPDDFPQNISFQLTPEESTFLKERIKSTKSALPSMLAVLADADKPWEKTRFAWEYPDAVADKLPKEVSQTLAHARNFSELIHGASLLYNLMVAKRFYEVFKNKEDKIGFYESEIETWAVQIAARNGVYVKWDRQEFWQAVDKENPSISLNTATFINKWLDLVLRMKNPADVAKDAGAQAMLFERERRHKPTGMARLVDKTALSQWSGAAGANQLDFRWRISQDLLTDILSPRKVTKHA